MPTVSIIVPVYKVEPYLHRCVDSILAQTFTDFELILVDDGSLDSCPAICDEYAQKDSRVRVIHKPNSGLSSARNAGLDVATGEYVLFVDSDDYVLPNLLAKVVQKFNVDIDRVTFNFYYADEIYSSLKVALSPNDRQYDISTATAKQQFFACDLLNYAVGWAAWASVYKRSIIEQYNIRFVDTKKIFAEDLLFSLCYSSCCSQIAYVSEPLYYYVVNRSGSIMDKENHEINADRMNQLCRHFYSYIQDYKQAACLRDIFSDLFFILINDYLHGRQAALNLPRKEIRKKAIDNVQDLGFFQETMACYSHTSHNLINKKWYRRWYEKREALYWAYGRRVDLWMLQVFDFIVKIKGRLKV